MDKLCFDLKLLAQQSSRSPKLKITTTLVFHLPHLPSPKKGFKQDLNFPILVRSKVQSALLTDQKMKGCRMRATGGWIMSAGEARSGRRCDRQSLCGPPHRPSGNRDDLLASGSPHAVPALPESPNVITGLLVVSGSTKLRCTRSGGSGSMNVGSLLSEEVPVPDGLQRRRLRALRRAPPLNTRPHTYTHERTHRQRHRLHT